MALVVGDIIASLTLGVPPFTFAALIVKRGMSFFCHCGKSIGDERPTRLLQAAQELKSEWSRISSFDAQSLPEPLASQIQSRQDQHSRWLLIIEDVIQALSPNSEDSQQEDQPDHQ